MPLVRALPLGLMGVLFACHLALMGVGAMLYEAGRLDSGLFNLDGEGRYFVYFSASVLLSGALLAFTAVAEGRAPRLALGFGALLAFMAVDEALVVHEHLEAWLHVDWPILYAPIMAFGALVVLHVMRATRAVPGVAPAFLAGGGCWAATVVLEKLQWTDTGEGAHYVAMMIPEELLEATGSFLFAIGFALLLRATARP